MTTAQQLVPNDRSLLAPRQVEDYKGEIASLEEQLKSPHIEDKAEVRTKLIRMRRSFEQQVPHAPENAVVEDQLVKRGRQLLSEIVQGMPSQEEMRKAPPGAVDKHRAWEARNKARIVEWKNIQRRLFAGSGDNERANLERYRPKDSTLSMDNAYIPGKQYHLPPEGAGMPVTFSDEQLSVLRGIDPEIAEMVGSMNNRQRAEVKDAIGGIGLADKPVLTQDKQAASEAGKRGMAKKREVSQAQREALARGRATAAANREKKAA